MKEKNKKKTGKMRLLSLVLSLSLLLGLVPTPILAEGEINIGDIEIFNDAAETQQVFDNIGTGIATVTNENGIITIDLLKDIIGRISICESGNYVLDANGHTFTGGNCNEAICMNYGINATLTLTGNGTYNAGIYNTLFIGGSNTLKMNSGTIIGNIYLESINPIQFLLEEGYDFFTVKNNGVNLFDEENTETKMKNDEIFGTGTGLVVAQHIVKIGDVGTGGTGVRSLTDAFGNVFLGNQYIEIGIAPAGSFGTTAAAPTEGTKFFHPDTMIDNRIGLRSDGDGWDIGEAPATHDFFLPGVIDEGFMIGWSDVSGETTTLRSAASQIGVGDIYNFTGYSVTDKSTETKLMAESVGTAANTLQYTQNVSFGAEDKLFTTTITLKNTSADPVYNTNYIRKFDPDQSLTQASVTDNYFFRDVTGGVWVVASSDPLDVPSPVSPENHKAALDKVQNPFVFYTDDPRAQAISCPYGTTTFEEIQMRGTALYGNHYNTDTGIGLEFKFPVINPGESVTFTYQSSLDPNFKAVQQAIEDLAVVITKQPVSRTYVEGKIDGKLVVQGDMLIDGVSADSEALTYQWYTNTTNSTEGGAPVLNATQRSFEIPKNLSANTTTYYYCVASVTTGESVTSAASGVATIKVVPVGSTINSVKFNENSTNIVSNMPAMQTLASGEKITQPTDPSITGMEFTGWFTAPTDGTKWDFNTPVNADTILYAQWQLPDTTKPVISDIAGNPATWGNTDKEITFTVTDDRELATVTVSKDGGAEQTLTGESSNYGFTTDGNGTYLITATDAKGNISTQTVEVTKIDKIIPVISEVTGNPSAWTNGDVTLTVTANDTLSGLAADAYSFDNGVTWQSGNSKVFTSNQTVQVKVMDASGNISEVSMVNITKMDLTAPTGDIKIGTNSIKKALNLITFGLFFKDTQSVEITSADNESGVASVVYKLSSAILDENAVTEISDWTAYNGAFTIEPDAQTVVYAKITDTTGNIVYLGSDGLVLDSTNPVISGIVDGQAYCAAVDVTVTDEYLAGVTVNDVAVTLTDGIFTLSPTGVAQTVVATDKSGNSTIMTVTVYDGHTWDEGTITVAPTASQKGTKTYTCIHCGETRTEEIAMLAPTVTEGQNGKWKPEEGGTLSFKSDAAFADFLSVLIDGNVIDAQYYVLEEDNITITLNADYLATLTAGTHTLGIQSASGTATTEFSIEEKTPEPTKPVDTEVPDTGDHSNLFILFALLFTLPSAATVIGMKERMRKAVK